MDFKIKYHIFKTTSLPTQAIIERIRFQLKEKEYRLINETNQFVTFDINQWAPRWNYKPTRLDGGEFEISITDNCTTVSLNYYSDLLTPLIMYIIMIAFLLINRAYEGILFFGAFYLITGIIHLVTSKIKAKELLYDILDVSTSDENAED